MPINKNPKYVCYYCGTRYGYKTAVVKANWHKGQCNICGKLESLTEARNFGNLQNDWFNQYSYDVKRGIQPW